MPETHQKYPQLQLFLNYLQFEKRYSINTVDAYRNDLEQFFLYLVENYDSLSLLEIKSSFIRSWLVSMKSGDISSKSINRKASSLKSFFKYQLKLGSISTSPMISISTPKIKKRLPEFVLEEDLDTLLNIVEFPDNWKGKTERLVIQVFYSTGMRLSELINLKESDVDFSNSQLKVLGKGNKMRNIPLSNDMLSLIRIYISQKPKSIEEIKNLFVNEQGKKLQQRSVYAFVHNYLSLITTIKKRSPHILRHSFATHLMNNGADLNAVKELLGHASLASTQVYTHNNIEKLKDIFNKAHPKA